MGDSADVEMKDVESPQFPQHEIADQIEQSFNLLHKASVNFDNRYISMIFRDLRKLRVKLVEYPQVLPYIISKVYESAPEKQKELLRVLDVEIEADNFASHKFNNHNQLIGEIELYLHLLIQINLLDRKKLSELDQFNNSVILLMKCFNKRSLDFLQAKIWFYIARTKELLGDLFSIRPELLACLRTATLRHDNETQASILTALLRNYLLTHDINQATNLIEKSQFPENGGNALFARYYYYLAKINAIQLDYSTAHEYVIAAIRKAPQTSLSNGFVQSATKLRVIIELLMGDIPELKVFKKQTGNFEPYFNVTKAVKLGDLKLFGQVLTKFEPEFKKDDNFTLVSRLRQNVIKTGIRIISLSYSKISLKDICIKLHLDSEESAEYIVSKAIRDGVIEATINHEKGYMQSNELLDVYSTKLPQNEFDQRIRFCLSLHNDSVKCMRYPSDNDDKLENNDIDESRDDEMDLLKAIEEGDLDDFMD
jgi:26S proteasome regulatory subunit N3